MKLDFPMRHPFIQSFGEEVDTVNKQLKSFIKGMGRALDLGSTLNERAIMNPTADLMNLKKDWNSVGNDIKSSRDWACFARPLSLPHQKIHERPATRVSGVRS